MEGNNQEIGAMFNQASTDEYFHSLPPGYRFNPTDRELILYYLNRKVLNESLPLHRIHEINIYQHHPQELSEMFPRIRENGWYFFSTRKRKYLNGTRPNRAARGGHWKATGRDVKITDDNGEVIGQKKVLEFNEGTHKDKIKTEWKMHEYRIKDNKKEVIPPPKRKKGEGNMKLDIVLCKIYLNTRGQSDTDSNDAISTPENSDQGVLVTDMVTSHDKDISVKHGASQDQPLDSSLICSQYPQLHNNTTGGFNNMDHKFNSSTTLDNCFYSSNSMNNGFCETTHYGGCMKNEVFGPAYQRESFSNFHNQDYTNYSMYSEHMPSSSKSYPSQLPSSQCSTEIWTRSEPEYHEIPLMDDSTSVSLPTHVNEYEFMLKAHDKMPIPHVNKDEADDEGLQFLSIPDEVHEDDSNTDRLVVEGFTFEAQP